MIIFFCDNLIFLDFWQKKTFFWMKNLIRNCYELGIIRRPGGVEWIVFFLRKVLTKINFFCEISNIFWGNFEQFSSTHFGQKSTLRTWIFFLRQIKKTVELNPPKKARYIKGRWFVGPDYNEFGGWELNLCAVSDRQRNPGLYQDFQKSLGFQKTFLIFGFV